MWYNNDVACQMTYKNVDCFIRGGVVMKRSTKKKLLCVVIMLCALCISGKEQKVYAAKSGYVKLVNQLEKNNEEKFTQYDLDGDGENDEIVISTQKESGDEGLYIFKLFINGERPYQCVNYESESFWDVGLVYLKNGKVFLHISEDQINTVSGTKDNVDNSLYKYNGRYLEYVYSFYEDYRNYTNSITISLDKVKGNTIYTNALVEFNLIRNDIKYKEKHIYKKGKIQRDSKGVSIKCNKKPNNKWKVNRKIKVYKKPRNKNIAYTLKKGDVIKINKVIFKRKKIYFQVKNKNGKGKTGYIPAITKYPRKEYFK